MKFAVIGSGPCGSLAALLLLQAGHQVELFDVDSDDSLDPDGLTSKLKLVGSSSAPYDIQQICRLLNLVPHTESIAPNQWGGFQMFGEPPGVHNHR